MKANVAALILIGALAIGFYALLSNGAGEAISDALVQSGMPGTAEATSTPGIEVRVPVVPTATPTPVPVTQPVVPVSQPENRSDCNVVRGTDYRSEEERRWYLENCVSRANRASCGQIRGTRYLSITERNWYLSNCVR